MAEPVLLPFPASPSTVNYDLHHPDKKKKVARCLFGRPDPIAQNAWLRDRLNEVQQEQNNRWNFDFENDHPLSGGRFEFVGVPETDVPAYYRSKTIKSQRRRRTAEENEAPVAVDCVASSSASSLSSTSGESLSDAPELETADLCSNATPAVVVKRQAKITDHFNARKRRLQRATKVELTDDWGSRSSSSSSSASSSQSNVDRKRPRGGSSPPSQ